MAVRMLGTGMTEAEWLACADVRSMFSVTWGRVSDRKIRLFAVACCQPLLPLLTDSRSRSALTAAAAFADGACKVADLRRAAADADRAAQELAADRTGVRALAVAAAANAAARAADATRVYGSVGGGQIAANGTVYAAAYAAKLGPNPGGGRSGRPASKRARRAQAVLLRDVVGNPFRPVAVDPRWRTADTVGLARAIYEDRAFGRFPLLGDALMDAGCSDDEILEHCQSAGPHVRGCWVVDLLLGKE